MGKLSGQVVLIMGGGADGPPSKGETLAIGNGRAIALCCAREGASVVVADLNHALAHETALAIEEEGGAAIALACDVGDDEQCEAAVRAAVARFGTLDGLVNNVGIVDRHSAADAQASDFERVMHVNVTGQLNAIRHAVAVMRGRGRGSIVNISSLAGLRSAGLGVGYEVSKAALSGLTRNAAMVCGKHGIRVNAVLPGTINSTVLRRHIDEDNLPDLSQSVPLGRLGTPWEVAKAAAFLLSDDASYITGAELIVDGGAAIVTPGL